LKLLFLCEEYPDQDESPKDIKKNWRDLYSVENFKDFVIPADKRLWKELNEKYRNAELNYDHPTQNSKVFVEHPLLQEYYRKQVPLYKKDHQSMLKKLRQSNSEIKLSKGGFTLKRTHTSSASRSATPFSGRTEGNFVKEASGRTNQSKKITPRHKSAPLERTQNIEIKKKVRPQSSPPVVVKSMAQETESKLIAVNFEMSTQNRRWTERYDERMSEVLPNYEVVLTRIANRPSKPCVKPPKKKKMRTIPSPATIRRLAESKPMFPTKHVTHCDALRRGFGDDSHAKTLQHHGEKTVKKPRKRKKRAPDGKSALLERLLESVGSPGGGSDSDDESTSIKATTSSWHLLITTPGRRRLTTGTSSLMPNLLRTSALPPLSSGLQFDSNAEQESDEKRETTESRVTFEDSVPTVMKTRDKVCEALKIIEQSDIINKTFYRESSMISLGTPDESPRHAVEDLGVFPEPPPKSDEITDFESFVSNPENVRVPDNAYSIEPPKPSRRQLRKQRKSFHRIAQRLQSAQQEDMVITDL
jgi:hypothetical protein